MSHLSFLGCEPARCGNWAARGLEFKRTVGVPHGVRKRRGLNAIFRPPTGFSRDARVRFRRDAGLSCRWLLARQLKLVVWTAAPAPMCGSRGSGSRPRSRARCGPRAALRTRCPPPTRWIQRGRSPRSRSGARASPLTGRPHAACSRTRARPR